MASLHNRILIGLVAGAGAGVAANLLATGDAGLTAVVDGSISYAFEPVGQIFLRLLFMIVIPLVFASLALGVVELGNLQQLGRLGLGTVLYFIATSAVAVGIGLLVVNVLQPGVGLDSATRDSMLQAYGGQATSTVDAVRGQPVFSVQTLVNIVPRNPVAAAAAGDMLPVIFFSLFFGFALTQIQPQHKTVWIDLLRGLGDATVVIINVAMKLAPYGVFALIFAVTARFGLDILRQLSAFVVTVLIGLLLHSVIVYGFLVRWLVGMNPWLFLKKVRAAVITAFSTSSSSATLPTTMKVCQEELGVPAPIAGFVLPLGATLNMDGTALFEGVTAIFLAQVFGIDLTILQQLTVIVLAVVTSIGVAGVPGGSIPLLVLVITAIGVPPEGIAIIIGVDRLLDMCRTAVNVTGDTVRAAFAARTAERAAGRVNVP